MNKVFLYIFCTLSSLEDYRDTTKSLKSYFGELRSQKGRCSMLKFIEYQGS
jgi:hypothetical protein